MIRVFLDANILFSCAWREGSGIFSKEPLILTVNGKAKLVIQDAEAYQKTLDKREYSRFMGAVQQGLEEAESGLGWPAEKVFAEVKSKFDL